MNTYNGYNYLTMLDLFDPRRENIQLVQDDAAVDIGCIITITDTEVKAQDLKGKSYQTENVFLGIDFLIRSYNETPVKRTAKPIKNQATLQF